MTERWAATLQEQKNYYDARAGEYDQFWLRRGPYALAEPLASQWNSDAADTMAFVAEHARGDVLELACGTGIFTDTLRRSAESVHAVDASPAMLDLNRGRTDRAPNVSYERADLFDWEPARRFDVVFFAFWLSHVPDDLFAKFWQMVENALEPGGVAAFVDSVPYPADGVAADDTRGHGSSGPTERRTLNDGRTFQIVKRYWEPDTLIPALRHLGWNAQVETSAHRMMLRGVSRPVAPGPR